jgi:predicted GH43/DUF377 family glycosyl hydrolase
MSKKIISLALFFVCAIFILSACYRVANSSPVMVRSKVAQERWVIYENNPVIKYGHYIRSFSWNDPSVIKEDGKYHMWLTGGNPSKWPIEVSVYKAVSYNGVKWLVDPEPVLKPGTRKKDWDGLRTETPSVIKVRDTYHMYYSGCDAPCGDGKYNIGHATSTDGVNWKKDPRNPVVKADNTNPLKWGYYYAAEPAIAYNKEEKLFYLYYASAKSRYPKKGSNAAILLSTSKDGSRFEAYVDAKGEKQPVLTLSDHYDQSVYRGFYRKFNEKENFP